MFDNIGFEKSFKLAILALTNTVNSEMYNLQNLNFSELLISSKIALIIFMIIGKIELISVFLIFKKVILGKKVNRPQQKSRLKNNYHVMVRKYEDILSFIP